MQLQWDIFSEKLLTTNINFRHQKHYEQQVLFKITNLHVKKYIGKWAKCLQEKINEEAKNKSFTRLALLKN